MDSLDAANRDLLIGLLALQNGLVEQDDLISAFRTWTRDKSRPIAEILAEKGAIDADERALLEGLARKHLKRHGGDVEKSLAAMSVGLSTRESLEKIGDPEIEATLAHVGSTADQRDTERTGTYHFGSAASDGQRFRVLRPHAQGGLGAVFVALDQELHREVALKQILDHHADDANSRTRFVLEAEITGGLEHPGIVPVYGLGSYGDGRPYYAMRFVRGDSLKEAIAAFHADEAQRGDPGGRALALRKLLRRFVDVCNAIDYAHSRGVLHRDIKPANVIVGRHGETLVVDWGLAKAIGRSDFINVGDERPLTPSSSSGSAETLPGSALGTPAYMSPEQSIGDLERLGPRSDVYSLGATLYCLLTGKAPFEGNDLGAVLRAVRVGNFPRPRTLDPSLERPLEAVCLKAMATDPNGRYSSCRALAEDIERWVADEPVSAYREPFAVRLRRWMRRHRTLVSAIAAAMIVAVVGMSALILVQVRANRAERRSKALIAAQFDLALGAVKAYYQGVAGDVLLAEPALASLKQTLLRFPQTFFQDLKTTLETGGDRDPKSRKKLADACTDLGKITFQIGKPEDAVQSYQEAIVILEALALEEPREAEGRIDLAENYLHMGTSEKAMGRTDRAEKAIRTALGLLEQAVKQRPNDARASFELANAHNSMAMLDQSTGRPGPAETAFLAALAIRVELDRRERGNDRYRDGLAWTHNSLGLLYRAIGKSSDAGKEYRAAIEIQEDLTRRCPDVARYRLSLAEHYNNLAIVQNDLDQNDDAIRSYREAIRINLALCRDQPVVAKFRDDLGVAYTNLGGLYDDLHRNDDAEQTLRSALEVMEPLAREYPDNGEYQNDLASVHNNLGLLFKRTGRMDRSESAQAAAVEIRKGLSRRFTDQPLYRMQLAGSLANLADLARTAEGYARSLGIYAEVIDMLGEILRSEPNDATARSYLGNAYLSRAEALGHLSRHADSLADWDRAVEMAGNDRDRSSITTRRALTRIRVGQIGQAVADAEALARENGSIENGALYNVACVFSRAAEAIARESRVEPVERERRAGAYAARSISLLRRLDSQSFFEDTAHLTNLRSDPDLDALKPFKDFQDLLLDAGFPGNPFAR